eukprot:CAMPEP_0195307238 /NCGR_PEP_ID=MMETSP0707-20130614/37614_1 /TAXON_ID=33640 /ORGANISM="Asterionellopsis glacialis, Strain CCMP134" /LENGTH=385 /DNA_ID=CAMNT_0040371485 /DNA_START=341 /DNA_END=1498 /DNA_ORIENTATION=-
MEMARLSKLIYAFKHDTSCNATNSHGVPILPPDLKCHYYEHETIFQGTQVMIFSSFHQKYIAVVYAGTDNLRTLLSDTDILQKPLGPLDDNGDSIWLPGPARVHAGFDNAVFDNNLFERVVHALESVIRKYPSYRLFTAGHSLGAADATLAAIGLSHTLSSVEPSNRYNTTTTATTPRIRSSNRKFKRKRQHELDRKITCINFGCPRIGNKYFSSAVNEMDNIGIWRFVLGKDLIPRLPDKVFFDHVGHTIQLDTREKHKWYYHHGDDDDNDTDNDNVCGNNGALAYYLHHGNETMGYEGVPIGWNSKSFVWVPGAMESHFMRKYLSYFSSLSMTDPKNCYVDNFVLIPKSNTTTTDDDDGGGNMWNDDDPYSNPPDDYIIADLK